jgi:hypothetical protein
MQDTTSIPIEDLVEPAEDDSRAEVAPDIAEATFNWEPPF